MSVAVRWFVFAFAVRAIYIAAHGIVLSDDSTAYLQIATNLATRGAYSLDPGGLVPTVRYAPFYPALLAMLQWLGLTPAMAIVWLQAAADALTTGLVFLLARRVATPGWAGAAAAMYALHPGAIAASASVLTETTFTTLLAVSAYAVSRGTQSSRVATSATAGALLGIAALCRPIGLAYVLVFAGVMAFARGTRQLAAAAALVAAAVAVVAPWAWRSSALAGRFVPVQAASPVLIYLPTRTDWNQRDQAALWPAFSEDDEYGRRFTAARTPREMIEADAVGRRLAIENIRRHPGDYVRSRLATMPYLVLTSFDAFAGRPKTFGAALAERDWRALTAKLGLMGIFCVLPLALALIGAMMRPHDVTSAVAASLWIATLVIHVPMWIEPRFWLPAVPFVLVTAARAAARRSTFP